MACVAAPAIGACSLAAALSRSLRPYLTEGGLCGFLAARGSPGLRAGGAVAAGGGKGRVAGGGSVAETGGPDGVCATGTSGRRPEGPGAVGPAAGGGGVAGGGGRVTTTG
ncbi:MAG TPA: hypothetical protein VJV79_18375 [Polyangiaceae bacterium]|nr:hypothetical protein [Polyangiaceae bacterium]